MSGTSQIPGITDIVGSALLAQRQRLDVIASNIANADSITTPGGQAYRAREVVFAAVPADGASPDTGISQVSVAGTVLSAAPLKTKYDPSSPYANAQGYVSESNVSPTQEMINLIDASQSYAANVAVLNQNQRAQQAMIQSFQP
jgi:flagellar basal-body rod protein FlgC